MRYILFTLAFVFLLPFNALATTGVITPNPIPDDTTDLNLNISGAMSSHVVVFASNGRVLTGFTISDGDVSMGTISDMVTGWWSDPVPFGTIRVLEIPQIEVEDCIANYDSASFEAELGTSPTENLYSICNGMFPTIGNAYYGEIASGGFSGLLSIGETAYEETTGESMGASVSWAGENVTKPFMGAGLALLYALRYWIVALSIISLVVYFSYRAFRFFNS